MTSAFVSYIVSVINGTFNFMDNAFISGYGGITVLAVFVVTIFISLSMELIER